MSWFKVDDKLHAHPKVAVAGLRGMGLWVVAGSWSAAYELDGYVSAEFVRAHGRAGARAAAELVDAGLWLPASDGWAFHDWEQSNPTRAEVELRRQIDRERKAEWRAAKALRNGYRP